MSSSVTLFDRSASACARVQTTPFEISGPVAPNPIVHGSAMFRRIAYDAAGGYREIFAMAQDFDLWLRMSRFGDIHILPEELYCLREHPNRISVQSGPQQRAWAQAARWARRSNG